LIFGILVNAENLYNVVNGSPKGVNLQDINFPIKPYAVQLLKIIKLWHTFEMQQ